MQFFAMQDRTVRDLLGSTVDRKAYPPPKSVHRANLRAAIRPCSFPHDDSSSLRKSAGQCRHYPGGQKFRREVGDPAQKSLIGCSSKRVNLRGIGSQTNSLAILKDTGYMRRIPAWPVHQ